MPGLCQNKEVSTCNCDLCCCNACVSSARSPVCSCCLAEAAANAWFKADASSSLQSSFLWLSCNSRSASCATRMMQVQLPVCKERTVLLSALDVTIADKGCLNVLEGTLQNAAVPPASSTKAQHLLGMACYCKLQSGQRCILHPYCKNCCFQQYMLKTLYSYHV